jgi:hypothetical protein
MYEQKPKFLAKYIVINKNLSKIIVLESLHTFSGGFFAI